MRWGRDKKSQDSSEGKDNSANDNAGKSPQDLSKYDCYSILGVTYNASEAEIRNAYRRLALQYHPDRNKSPDAPAVFVVIQMAYDTLVDQGRRRRYDSTIPVLESRRRTGLKAILEGAYTEGFLLDDRAAIFVEDSDEAIVFENGVSIPTIWIHKNNQHRQFALYSDAAFERLFRTLYAIIEPQEKLKGLVILGTPELRAHFDARFWNRGQTNVSLYCHSSITFSIVSGIPYLYLSGARYYNTQQEITVEFYSKMAEAISSLLQKELEGAVEPPEHILEPATLFQPVKVIAELKLPPREICESFARLCRVKSAQAALEMLSKVYGVPPMQAVFQHRFPVKDMVCENSLAVYYSDKLTAYFRPEGTTMMTILHEFYHHLVNCYGARLDYDVLPDVNTGYYARNAREEAAANSYADAFLRRAVG
ncbi:MAG: J domain-containing protein [Nitrososphaera sp.]